ncbi:hypothetical protein LIER_05893 [Lithospermum erythrorhizon]|uniref:Uncharacterized protein n=1 Tax=Lithospermum erythrorhizon TaxID=34254 RepID=A0AAV3P2S8_LITER
MPNELIGSDWTYATSLNSSNHNLVEQEADHDLPHTGCKYSWSGTRRGIMVYEKLDRAMGNFEWSTTFPTSSCVGLPIQRSDHGPLLISIKNSKSSIARPFKLESFLTHLPDFPFIVTNSWSKPFDGNSTSSSSYTLIHNLKNVKNAIKSWNKDRVGNLFNQIKSIPKQLSTLQNNPSRITNQANDSNLHNQVDLFLKSEEEYWRQRSKLTAVTEGDKNTKFFHSHIKHKAKINNILELKDLLGNLISGEEEIKNHCRNYFVDLFNPTHPSNSTSTQPTLNPFSKSPPPSRPSK